MDVAVTEAESSERDTFAQLLELNAYEFSRIDSRVIGPDGRFGYEYLDAYWTEPHRTPYLLRVAEEIAGFALISRLSGGPTSISEFLVLPKFRRTGVGTQSARRLFDLHHGPWQVAQVPGNSAATHFWRHAIPVPYQEEVRTDGTVIQRFTT